ncbi:hypothetical protein B484DRAFT_448919 [Ochromonadaceae sp. CCMP2298]|nr:hypothetical protein B484DRAFT_448919 [Ochromonadaceae sp. CCMP2298]
MSRRSMKLHLNRAVACTVCRVVTKEPVLNNCLHAYCVPCRRVMRTAKCPMRREELCGEDEAYGRGLHCTLRAMALLDESGASAEVEELVDLGIKFFQKASRVDTNIPDLAYYCGWTMDFRGEHLFAAGMYREAVEVNKSDWRVLEKLIQLYLKVSLPSAALHFCELYHTALESAAEEVMLSKMSEVHSLVEAANRDIVTPRWRFKVGDRFLISVEQEEGWREGQIVKCGHRDVSADWPEWMGLAPYKILMVHECDCDVYCTCRRTVFGEMDSDNTVRTVTAEYRQALRRPPVIAGPVDMAAVEKELLPLLAPRDRSWLESTGDVAATVSRLWLEYNRLVAPRKRLGETHGPALSPAVILFRLFPEQSENELRSTAENESLEKKVRVAALLALGDCALLGMYAWETDVEGRLPAAHGPYMSAFHDLGAAEGAVAVAVLYYLRQLPLDQRWSASLSNRIVTSMVGCARDIWGLLEQSVLTGGAPRVCQFLLWRAKHAQSAAPDYDLPLSNAMCSVVERAEDITPTQFPLDSAGGGQGAVDYRALIKRAQASFAAGRFKAALEDYFEVHLLLPSHTPKVLSDRLSYLTVHCQLSNCEAEGPDSDSAKGVDQVVEACTDMLNPKHKLPPDVVDKVIGMLVRATEFRALRDARRALATEGGQDDFLAQHEQLMRSQGQGRVSARQRRQMRTSQRERAHARSRHSLPVREAVGEEHMQREHTIQTCEVLASNVEGLALNAGDDHDCCPFCWTPWSEFAEDSALAVVLPCRHAVCLCCLSQEWKACSSDDSDTRFACGLCRGLLPPALVPSIAAEVLEQHSADSGLASLVQRLSMPERAQKALLASLLVLQDFDFSQVLAKLMDIVGSLGHLKPDLTSEQKQRIVARAREREKYLWEQLTQVRGELDELLDLGSAQGRTLRQRLNMLYEQVRDEAASAADEIFRQTNEVRSMATETQGQCVLDLHGLYVAEALQKVQEVVLPVLPVVGFMLITGRGLHSSRAEGQVHSVLKAAVGEYLQQRGLAVEPVPTNDGAIYVLCTTS